MDNSTMEINKPVRQELQPITTIGYIGYMILFAIPLVGLIMMLIYAFGSETNVNLKNFARAYLVLLIIGIIIGIFSFAGIVSLLSAAMYSSY